MTRSYQVLKEIVLRGEGGSYTLCKVVPGRAHINEDSTNIMVAVVTEDQEHFNAAQYSFRTWFPDWEPQHNFRLSNRTGRDIEVALSDDMLGRLQAGADFSKHKFGVVAVNIDNVWTPPAPIVPATA